ncbi:MAG: DUF998 domain-containing protein [Thermoplasmata archaeon]|nr:DUF998 domain-containing protein [Thermoplasmata archaeon]
MAFEARNLAGLLLFLGAVQFAIGLMIAAALTPNYSIANDTISSLGVREGALVFNVSIIILGLLVLGAAYFVRSVFGSLVATLLIAIAGVGVIGVGVFPASDPLSGIHSIFSLITFVFINVAAIYVARFLLTPFLHLSIILGVIGLVAMGLFLSGNYLGLGLGGMERMIVLPVLAWALALGGYLMAGDASK